MSSHRSKALCSHSVIFTTLILLCSHGATLWSQVEWTVVAPKVFGAGDPGAWDSTRFRAHTFFKEDETYRLWYMGSAVDPSDFETGWQAGCASTEALEDPLAWSRDEGNPCLAFPGPLWDVGVHGLTVLRDDSASPNERYKMWYGGARGSRRTSIGYATSPDGVSWTRFSDQPVLEADRPWEGVAVEQPAVVFDGALYRMWYMGTVNLDDQHTWLIGYATSPDGIEWTKYEGNPVLRPGGPEGSTVLNWPHVTFDEATSTFEMWYTLWVEGAGTVRAVGYATSIDGATWVKHPGNPLIFSGGSVDLSGPVLREGDTYLMLSNAPAFELGSNAKASYATAPWTIPKASFTISSQSLTCADEVQVDAARSAAPNGIARYSWDFGDGTTATGVKATHSYARAGRDLIQLTVTDASSGTEGLGALPVEVACCEGDVTPWTAADIGEPRVSGGARLEGSGAEACVAVCAGGRGITGSSDQCHFVYQELTGEGTLTARVSDVSGGGTAARAGLMVRETLDPASRHGALFAQGSRFRWVSRKDVGGSSRQTSGGTAALPAWLRMERKGDDLIGSSSPDGMTWTEVSRETLAGLEEKVYFGIAATGGDPGGSSAFRALEAHFCDVALAPASAFRRGDTDGSGNLTLTDAIALLGYLFLGTAAPACQDAADANDDGDLGLSDAIFNLGYQFLGTAPPPPPGPDACGIDPTDDELPDCDRGQARC